MDIVEKAKELGIILSSDTIDLLKGRTDWQELLTAFAEKYEMPMVANADQLNTLISERKREASTSNIEIDLKTDFIARDEDSDIEIEFNYEKPITIPSNDGFHSYILDRFHKLAGVLKKQYPHLKRAGSIETYKKRAKRGNVRVNIICMIQDVKSTSSGAKSLVLEDETGTVDMFIPSEDMLKRNYNGRIETARSLSKLHKLPLVKDSVIGVTGEMKQKSSGGVTRFQVYPSAIYLPAVAKSEKTDNNDIPDLEAAFISDVHMGSKTFMEDNWRRFISWLNGKYVPSERFARHLKKLKYLVIVGDLVDGIGVFPNQENELNITDIYEQYEAFGKELEQVPDHIEIIVLPGNHDAARPSEPQPPLMSKYAKYFPDRVWSLSNPTRFRLSGVDILAYHGCGFDELAMSVPGLGYNDPIGMMKTMLKLGLLVPTYGGKTPIAPDPVDNISILHGPDIFVTGHVHKHYIGYDKNTMLINASTWQTQTDYQKTMAFLPDPAKVTMVSLRDTKNYDVLEFL